MTAGKVHRVTIAGLVLVAFVLGSFAGDWVGMAVLAATALMTLAGSLWARADLVPYLFRGRVTSHHTGHRAGMVEGAALLAATGLVTLGAAHVGWAFDLAGWVLALLVAAAALLGVLFDLRTLGSAVQQRRGRRAP